MHHEKNTSLPGEELTNGTISWSGKHLILDLWDIKNCDDVSIMENILCEACLKANATILHSHFHKFGDNGGITGVVVLAESHLTIHTWPERNFAALDIFLCGDCNPWLAIPTILEFFQTSNYVAQEHKRGLRLNNTNNSF